MTIPLAARRRSPNRKYVPGLVTVDQEPDTGPPAVPTADIAGGAGVGWTINAYNDFDIPVAEGNFQNAASGYTSTTIGATRLGNLQFGYYTTADKDTRRKHADGVPSMLARTIAALVKNGTTTVTAASAPFLSIDVGRLIIGTGIPAYTTIAGYTSSTTVTLSNAATTSTTDAATITVDGGYYDPSICSAAADGILKIHPYVSADGTIHRAMIKPRAFNELNGYHLGGRYEVCFQADNIPGVKVAWLLWPKTDAWPRDGEIDFPECDLRTGIDIGGFMHWQGGTSGSSQSGIAATGVDVVTTGWNRCVIEWRPNAVTPASSTLKFILNGTTVGNFSGALVPNTLMNWRLMTESDLRWNTSGGYVPVNPTASGYVRIAWVAIWTPA